MSGLCASQLQGIGQRLFMGADEAGEILRARNQPISIPNQHECIIKGTNLYEELSVLSV